MPRKRNNHTGEIALPPGWDVATDYDGKVFYLNHTTRHTTWVDPRDRLTKPASFADCVGDELPYGWEQAYDSQVGPFFINHLERKTQLEDPRLLWRREQEEMLKDYLVHAHDNLKAKKEISDVKQERLAIASEEVKHLNDTLSTWKTSRTSLASTSSAGSTKYDPDLLKADVALARNRVSRLRREIEQISADVTYREQGLHTLSQVEETMTQQQHVFSKEQAAEVLARIQDIKRSVYCSQRQKQELLQALAELKDEVLVNKTANGSSPDVSSLCLSLPQEKFSTASQTDLSGEGGDYDNRWGEIVRMRLQYDEARKQVSHLQQELAAIESQMVPGQTEWDKDRLLLIQEKEQLLRELRALDPKGHSAEEMESARDRIRQLELDLRRAMELSNRQIAERLQLNESKSEILQKLAEATHLTSYLESQLRSLSLSTLSVSSGSSRSSRGSLGSLSAGSRGSLNSLSLVDIYNCAQTGTDINLPELHRRVERLLQDHGVGFSTPSLAPVTASAPAPTPAPTATPAPAHPSGQETYGLPRPDAGHAPTADGGADGGEGQATTAGGLAPGGFGPGPAESPERISLLINAKDSPFLSRLIASTGSLCAPPTEQPGAADVVRNEASSGPHSAAANTDTTGTTTSTTTGTKTGTTAGTTFGTTAANTAAAALGTSGATPPRSPQDPLPPPSYEQHLERQRLAAETGGGAAPVAAVTSPVTSTSDTRQSQHHHQHHHAHHPQAQPQQHHQHHQHHHPHRHHDQQQLQHQPSTPANGASRTEPATTQAYSSPTHQPPTYTTRALPAAITPTATATAQDGTPAGPAGGDPPGLTRRLAAGAEPGGGAGSGAATNPPLSPISESSSGVCYTLSGVNTRSVSAAVSDESVAGDSGVFEASTKGRPGDLDEVFEMSLEAAQVQIRLKYESVNRLLLVSVEQARNLEALALPDQCQVCIKAVLLPGGGPQSSFTTRPASDTRNPQFNETFELCMDENKLHSQTLQVQVWWLREAQQGCLGGAQVSLAAFDPRLPMKDWYNILSFHFMETDGNTAGGALSAARGQHVGHVVAKDVSAPASLRLRHQESGAGAGRPDSVTRLLEGSSSRLRRATSLGAQERPPSSDIYRDAHRVRSSSFDAAYFRLGYGPPGGAISSVKEESSDESTIISSQTSTLTRNQEPDDMDSHQGDPGVEGLSDSPGEEEEEDEDEEGEEGHDFFLQAWGLQDVGYIPEEGEDDDLSPEHSAKVITCDAETNTESCLRSRDGKSPPAECAQVTAIRRSQTFSPVGSSHLPLHSCKLNRSDSDSSVRYRRPFCRNAAERRSLRLKRAPVLLAKSKSLSSVDYVRKPQTSLDIELDLQASQARLAQLSDEIGRLKQLKHKFEEAKAKGDNEPEWFMDNDQLQQFMTEADKLLQKQERRQMSHVEQRADKLMRKARRHAHRLRAARSGQGDAQSFREKMAFFTTMCPTVPIVQHLADSPDGATPGLQRSAESLDGATVPLYQYQTESPDGSTPRHAMLRTALHGAAVQGDQLAPSYHDYQAREGREAPPPGVAAFPSPHLLHDQLPPYPRLGAQASLGGHPLPRPPAAAAGGLPHPLHAAPYTSPQPSALHPEEAANLDAIMAMVSSLNRPLVTSLSLPGLNTSGGGRGPGGQGVSRHSSFSGMHSHGAPRDVRPPPASYALPMTSLSGRAPPATAYVSPTYSLRPQDPVRYPPHIATLLATPALTPQQQQQHQQQQQQQLHRAPAPAQTTPRDVTGLASPPRRADGGAGLEGARESLPEPLGPEPQAGRGRGEGARGLQPCRRTLSVKATEEQHV